MSPIKTKPFLVFLLISFFVSSSFARSPHVINFRAPNLYPEGMTWDPSGQHFIVGSLRHPTIHAVSDAGVVETLISDPDLPSGAAILGLAVDSANQRLLAVIGSGALASYDLRTRSRIFLTHLPIPDDDTSDTVPSSVVAEANDVAVDFKGNAYVTGSARNLIWKVDIDGKASILSKNPLFKKFGPAVESHVPGSACGLNGIAHVSKGYLLVVQSNTGKMFKVDDESGWTRLVELNEDLVLPDDIAIRKDGIVIVVSQHNLSFLKSKDGWDNGVVFDKTSLNVEGFPTSVAVGDADRTYVLYGHVLEGITQNTTGGREWFSIEEVGSEQEGRGEPWIVMLVVLGLLYFGIWKFQMKKLISSMDKKTN